ncbi:hypothetical protein CLOM_g21962 [Closterium sp. NIES-68]|nr:hypothetical protein CLOM_g21962 [Closterium sp. NIES-68]
MFAINSSTSGVSSPGLIMDRASKFLVSVSLVLPSSLRQNPRQTSCKTEPFRVSTTNDPSEQPSLLPLTRLRLSCRGFAASQPPPWRLRLIASPRRASFSCSSSPPPFTARPPDAGPR